MQVPGVVNNSETLFLLISTIFFRLLFCSCSTFVINFETVVYSRKTPNYDWYPLNTFSIIILVSQ